MVYFRSKTQSSLVFFVKFVSKCLISDTFQALVQMSESNAAQQAKQNMENQNVFSGLTFFSYLNGKKFRCCTLRIDYSKLSTLNVKYNNDKSRDYTNPSLPSGEITLEQSLQLGLHSLLPTASPYSFTFTNPATAFLQTQGEPSIFSFI